MKILVLEDSFSAFNLMESILSRHNFEVYNAFNSKDFFNHLQKGVKPDLCILDIELDKGQDRIDGVEITSEELKRRNALKGKVVECLRLGMVLDAEGDLDEQVEQFIITLNKVHANVSCKHIPVN